MKQYVQHVIKPILMGKNPFDVESLAGGIAGYRGSAVWAGVDTALWDIIGKAKGLPLKEGLFKEKLTVKDGYLEIPDKPGLGVELKEGLAEQYPPIPGPWNLPDAGMPQ
jgi:L-alanine-DL-glutamate epimerase-like enolase superfamily enzyme